MSLRKETSMVKAMYRENTNYLAGRFNPTIQHRRGN